MKKRTKQMLIRIVAIAGALVIVLTAILPAFTGM